MSDIYRLRIPDCIAATIRGMHPLLKKKIKRSLQFILSEPFSGKALKGEPADLRSYRISRFRVIYRISGKKIEIVAIGPRSRIYEETYREIRKSRQD
ncbi:MAG: type II toxin-antitoxin system RelE/ParE family toxin [Syntrophales bacterium]